MRLPTLVTSLGLLSPASALLVADDSPCDSLCGNVLSSTTPDDIVCSEGSYTSSAGVVYQQCVTCELSSSYKTSTNDTDLEWSLYNIRYATAYCLFGVPSNDDIVNTPCLTTKACGPFRSAVLYKNLSSSVDGYDYCDIWPVNDSSDFKGCTSCLQAGDENYLANFFTVLQAGCEQKPSPGVTLSIEGSVFSSDIVNITEPTPTASVNPDWFDNGPITLGAKVGIAVGGLVFVLLILGFCIVWNGKRRRRAFLRNLENKPVKAWPAPLNISHQDMRETPLSQKPLRGWDDSPLSARSEKTFPQYVSPYSSQYNSPVSATELKLAHWPVMAPLPQDPMYMPSHGSPSVGVAYSADDLTAHSPDSKGKERQEVYEMQPVEGVGMHGMGIYQHPDGSYHSMPPQGYFDQQFHHPNHMFPNMYNHPHQQHHGYEEDAKR